MARALICLAPERAGLNGSLCLTEALRKSGWQVVYMTTPHFREYVERQGLECRIVGAGYEEETEAFMQSIRGLRGRARGSAVRRFEAERIQRIVRDQTEVLDDVRPDVVLVDPIMAVWSIAPLQRQIPLIELNPCFAWGVGGRTPPVFSGVAPFRAQPALSAANSLCAWSWLCFRQLGEQLRGSLHGASARALIHAAGGKTRRFEFGYRLDVPEIVLAPRELDFPLASAELGRRYVGLSVPEYQVEGGFDLEQLATNKKLAYCTLGTFSSIYDARPRMFRAAIEVFRSRPDWQLVIAIGDLDPQVLGPLPENVLAARMLPQHAIVRRAKLFIHQGGMGSLREAVHYGVPMVLFPCKNDQYGTAARAEFHQLGIRGDISTVTAQSLGRLVDHVTTSSQIASAVDRMRDACHRNTDVNETVEFLERYRKPSRFDDHATRERRETSAAGHA